jgi:hypothetical protein
MARFDLQPCRATRSLAEQFDGLSRDPGVELLADQPTRRRIVVPIDIEMVVQPRAPATRCFHGFARQWHQRWAVKLEEQVAAADAEATHWTRIQEWQPLVPMTPLWKR